ncbi:hypothetical protein BV22DRAFT_1037416 [Leucogyrophana mollusca]|uniref:Uncharacterized protein n=1 Tax=Leucogyrophana mollusca TaxID=85980 RepID=A0ACB8BA24_9AGAM|nr:hypothetical protein BV22DRAFT_1037416 [Leucogyrophana mollusca]
MLSRATVIGFLAFAGLAAATCKPTPLNGKDWVFAGWTTSDCKGDAAHTFSGKFSGNCLDAKHCTSFDKSTHLNDQLTSWAFTTGQGPRLILYSDDGCKGTHQEFWGTMVYTNTGPDVRHTSSFRVCPNSF